VAEVTKLAKHLGDHHESAGEDVQALIHQLAKVEEAAIDVVLQRNDWRVLDASTRVPPELTAARVDWLQDSLWQLVEAALDARLVAECIRAEAGVVE
jgi:hypothetical protein